jgi:hypothetical protein
VQEESRSIFLSLSHLVKREITKPKTNPANGHSGEAPGFPKSTLLIFFFH